MWKFEKEFRKEKPETIGETDKHFDLDNYKDWLENKLSNSIIWTKFSEKEPKKGQIVDVFSLARGREANFEYEGNGMFYNNDEDETREVLFSETDVKYNITHWIAIPDCC